MPIWARRARRPFHKQWWVLNPNLTKIILSQFWSNDWYTSVWVTSVHVTSTQLPGHSSKIMTLSKSKLCLYKIWILNSQALCEIILPLLWACFVLASTRFGQNQHQMVFSMNSWLVVEVSPEMRHFLTVSQWHSSVKNQCFHLCTFSVSNGNFTNKYHMISYHHC